MPSEDAHQFWLAFRWRRPLGSLPFLGSGKVNLQRLKEMAVEQIGK